MIYWLKYFLLVILTQLRAKKIAATNYVGLLGRLQLELKWGCSQSSWRVKTWPQSDQTRPPLPQGLCPQAEKLQAETHPPPPPPPPPPALKGSCRAAAPRNWVHVTSPCRPVAESVQVHYFEMPRQFLGERLTLWSAVHSSDSAPLPAARSLRTEFPYCHVNFADINISFSLLRKWQSPWEHDWKHWFDSSSRRANGPVDAAEQLKSRSQIPRF